MHEDTFVLAEYWICFRMKNFLVFMGQEGCLIVLPPGYRKLKFDSVKCEIFIYVISAYCRQLNLRKLLDPEDHQAPAW